MEEKPECQVAIVCEYCEENNIEFSCSCGKHICEKCLGKHIKVNPNHSASAFAEKPLSTKIACEKHIGEVCKLFCKTCCEPLCTDCLPTKHEGHSFLLIDDRLLSQRTVMEREFEKLEIEFKTTYIKLATDNEQNFSEVPAKYAAIREEVEEAGKALQKKVEEAVKKLKMQIERMEMEHLDCLNDNKIEIEKVIEDVEECKSDISKQMDDPKQVAKYQVKQYHFELDLEEQTLPVFEQSESEFNCFEFLGALTASKKAKISKLQEQTHTKEDDHEMKKSVDLLENARQVQKIATVYGYIYDLSHINNDRILVCGDYRLKNSFTIRALDLDGNEIMSIHVQYQPNYVLQAKDETIFYTSKNKEGVHRIKNGSAETMALENFWTPKGLVCRSSGDIIVAEQNEMKKLGRLSIYTSDGEKKQVIGINSSEYDLVKPTYVCVNNNSDICTSDEGQRTVFVFFSGGDLRFWYKGTSGKKECTSFTPRDLATDCMGNVLIADYLNHVIHVIDSEGYLLRYISKNVIFSTALSIDDRKRLLVGQYTEGSIQVVEYLKSS